jgi:outer membrane receptor protein involved in Fe transport
MKRFAFLCLLMSAASAHAGQATSRGVVVDVSGAAVPEARVVAVASDGRESPLTVGADGSFELNGAADRLRVGADGFAEVVVPVASASSPLRIVLRPVSFADTVVVTAGRGVERLPGAASSTVVTSAELANSAAGALDDALRQTPGFTLFRRSSSRVANPTTQGVTLRGVSGSGASRTLVLADGVPLNDPFGSWVYWNRVPAAAVDRVEIVRGAAGDLYGADALGGVVQVLTLSPDRSRLRATIDGGSHDTARLSTFGGVTSGPWFASAAGEWLRTDGVVTIAPEAAGLVDVRADSDYRTGFANVGTRRDAWRASLKASVYSEDRGNGTPQQVNSTAWRQLAGDAGGVVGGGAWEARVSGGTQEYFQTFTAVAADRLTERLTTEQWAPSDFVTASGQWSQPIGAHTLLVGAEGHRTESTVEEFRYSTTNVRTGPFEVGGTESGGAAFARLGIEASPQVSIGVGARVDTWTSTPTDATSPEQSDSFFSPRASVAWRVGQDVTLQGSAYRSYRTPTLNELHRGFRAGNVVTNANPLLEPERLTGVEGGVLYRYDRLSTRATAFLNQLDGAIANITLSTTPSQITRQRQNSDEIRSTGVELEADYRVHTTITINGQVTFTSSHFRGSIALPALEGNRVPQVPRVQFGAGFTWADPSLATASVQVRGSGAQFDDDLNTLELNSFAVVDAMVSRGVGRLATAFVAVENLFDEEYDTGRTPLRTIGWPRTVRVGVRFAIR